MVLQLLVFPRRPPGEHAVEVPPEGIKPRAVKPPIVLKPTPDDRVKHTGKMLKRCVAAQRQLPIANRSPYGLAGFLRNGRTEVDEVLSLPTLRASGTKRIAQKIKLLLSIPFPSIIILAIDNFRLFRMKLQPTFLHPPGNRCPHFLRRWGKPDSDVGATTGS